MKKENIIFRTYRDIERAYNFHDGIVMIYGLRGTTQIISSRREYLIKEAGIVILNPFEVYSIHAENGAVLEIRIPKTVLFLTEWQADFRFRLYVQDENPEYDYVREKCAELFAGFFSEEESSDRFIAKCISLINLLMERYPDSDEHREALSRTEEAAERLRRILEHIEAHWNEEISVQELAEKEYLSTAHLSRFFSKMIGMSISSYVSEFRFQKAAGMLAKSQESITAIALNCGFRSASAFSERFKERYGVTPRRYREKRMAHEEEEKADFNTSQNDVSALMRYLPDKKETILKTETTDIYVQAKESALKTSRLRQLINIGYARDGLTAEIQSEIIRANQEIGFEYVRFHGIFDQDMHIYHEENGSVNCDFNRLGLLLDFLVENHMRPYIELGFMPEELAIHPEDRIFDRPTVISGCKDFVKWKELIRQTLCFCINRYGISTVRNWRFTTISLNYVYLKSLSMDEYKEIYTETYHTVKEIDGALLFGGPGILSELVLEGDALGEFLKFVREEKCAPDFLTFQSYPSVDAANDPMYFEYVKHQKYAPSVISKDKNYLRHTIESIRSTLKKHLLEGTELFCEEITSTLWQRDLSGDTCYKAVWAAKNFCENMNQAVFGYWTLSDLLEERAYAGSVFHGGYGLFTVNGIPKAGYYGMLMCSRIQGAILGSGDGWIMTQNRSEYRLLLYNYCHYHPIYCYRYQRLEDPEKAYDIFEEEQIKRICLHLTGLSEGTYQIEQSRIGRNSGDAYASWIRIGAPNYPTQSEREYIIQSSYPEMKCRSVEVKNALNMEFILEPLETSLIIIKKIHK